MHNKFMTNYTIDFPAKGFLFLSSNIFSVGIDTLEESLINLADNCHIYMIVEVPRVSFIENSLIYDVDNQTNKILISIDIQYRLDNKIKTMTIEFEGGLSDSNIYLKISSFPHENLEVFTQDHKMINLISVRDIVFEQQIKELISYKVLYIGQSFGEEGNRKALDRLESHKTLQKILGDIVYSKPDKFILLGLFEFDSAQMVTMMNPHEKSESGIQDSERVIRAINATFEFKDQVSIIEACLIRYFQPEYNQKLKADLPNKKSKTLSECYSYDFSAISVNLFLDEPRPYKHYLYSDKVNPNFIHHILVDLHNEEDGKQFFKFKDETIPLPMIRHLKK